MYPLLYSGKADWSFSYLPESIVQCWLRLPNRHIVLTEPENPYEMEFNDHVYPLNITAVRQALASIIPRSRIISLTYGTKYPNGVPEARPDGLLPEVQSKYLSRVKLVRSRAILRIHLKLPHCLSQLDSIRVAAGGSCAAGSNPTAYLTDPLFHCLTALYPEARHTAAMPPGPNVLACAPANARHWRSSNNGAIVSNTALRPTSVISTPERGHGHRSGLATLTASPGTRRFTSATEKEPGRRSS